MSATRTDASKPSRKMEEQRAALLNTTPMIRVAGIDVPRAAIAELAARLHRHGDTALAEHIGVAIDENHEALTIPEPVTVHRLLYEEPIPGLEELRRILGETRPGETV